MIQQDERFLSLFSEISEEGETPEQDAFISLLEYIADRLDQIELNTRGGWEEASHPRGVQQGAQKPSPEKAPQRLVGDSIGARKTENPRKGGKTPPSPREKVSTAVARESSRPARHFKDETPRPLPHDSSPQKKETTASQKPSRAVSQVALPMGPGPRVASPPSPPADTSDGMATPVQTKSQEALETKRQEELAKSTSHSLVDAFRKNLATWDGSLSGEHTEIEDAAGVAAAGPVWGAVQEIKEVVERFGEDENSLLGTLKKTVADKTGVTAANAWVGEKKDALRSRLMKWAGGDPATAFAEHENTRDDRGRFKKKQKNALSQKPDASDAEEKQAEIAEQSLRLDIREAKNEEVRHEELVSAIRSIGGDSLLDSAGDLLRLKRGNRVTVKGRGPRVAAKKPGLFRRAGQTLAKGGKKIAGGAMATGGLLAGGLGIGKGGKTATTVARPVAEAGGGLLARASRGLGKAASGATAIAKPATALGGGIFKLGGKALLGGARAIPIAGQLLAAGLAVKDGFDGWSDTEGQRAAFGLQEGQEATTGQKASMAAANVLDMGGLLSGGASLFGFDINTGDIARTLYDATTSAGEVASSLKESATAIATDIGKGLGEMADTLSQKAAGLWTEASQTVSTAVSDAVSSASGLLDSAKATVSDTLASIQEKAAGLWDSAKETTSQAVATVVDKATDAWDATKEKTVEVVANVSDGASGLWNSTKNFFGFGEADDEEKGVTQSVQEVEQPKQIAPVISEKRKSANSADPSGKIAVAIPVTRAITEASHSGAERAADPQHPDALPDSEPRKGDDAQSVAEIHLPTATPTGITAPALSAGKQTSVAITDKDNQRDELGVDSVIADPSDDMSGMFNKLTTVMGELKDTISSETEKAKQSDAAFPATTGVLSGISSVFDKFRSTLAGIGNKTVARTQGPSAYAFQQAREMSSQGLGALSAKYESGTHGSSAIGWDAKGGTSYGKYQLSGKAGTMQEFLNFVKDKNPEIYNRLSAAGPADTGGKTGRFVDEWKSLVAEGKMGNLEHEFIKTSHFDPAFASIKSEELRNKVKGSRALQDVLWSTAVQHRNRTGDIFNGNWKDGMSEEDFIKAVYADRSTRFSTPQMRASGQKRMQGEVQNALAMLATEKGDAGIATSFAQPATEVGQKLATAASVSIMASTQDAVDRGVTYGFGGKNSQTGAVDCSGWIAEQNTALMDNINAVVGKDVFSAEARQVLKKGSTGGAAGIIQAVSEATGEQLSNAELTPDKIREGMMIGMDTGEHGWDAGRYKGIDHIVQTFRDPETGQMMVSESSSKRGVHATPYEEWYKQWGGKANLYGTDVTRLADASMLEGFKPATPETRLQEASPLSNIVHSSEARPVQPALQPEPNRKETESIREIREKQPSVQANDDMHLLLKEMKGMFAQFTSTLQGMAQKSSNGEEKRNNQEIRMDYDDPYVYNMAHDRV